MVSHMIELECRASPIKVLPADGPHLPFRIYSCLNPVKFSMRIEEAKKLP
jgi:hypothetical protein